MADANAAQKIWADMIRLENEKPGAQEDTAAFYRNKEKNMAKLRAAYAKATGLPADAKTSRAIAAKKQQRFIAGEKSPNIETKDTL